MKSELTNPDSSPGTCLTAIGLVNHLDREAACLEDIRAHLLQVQQAVTHGDWPALNLALLRLDQTMPELSTLRIDRASMRNQFALILRIPAEQITLRRLASAFPGELGDRLTHCRNRLDGLAKELDQVNRANAMLAHFNLDVLHRLITALTGAGPLANCYDQAGRKQDGVCGNLIEARG